MKSPGMLHGCEMEVMAWLFLFHLSFYHCSHGRSGNIHLSAGNGHGKAGYEVGRKIQPKQKGTVGWTVQCAMDMHFATLLGRLPFFSALMKGFSPIYVHGTPWGRLEEGEGQLRAGITALPGGCSQLVLHTKLGGCCTARPF